MNASSYEIYIAEQRAKAFEKIAKLLEACDVSLESTMEDFVSGGVITSKRVTIPEVLEVKIIKNCKAKSVVFKKKSNEFYKATVPSGSADNVTSVFDKLVATTGCNTFSVSDSDERKYSVVSVLSIKYRVCVSPESNHISVFDKLEDDVKQDEEQEVIEDPLDENVYVDMVRYQDNLLQAIDRYECFMNENNSQLEDEHAVVDAKDDGCDEFVFDKSEEQEEYEPGHIRAGYFNNVDVNIAGKIAKEYKNHFSFLIRNLSVNKTALSTLLPVVPKYKIRLLDVPESEWGLDDIVETKEEKQMLKAMSKHVRIVLDELYSGANVKEICKSLKVLDKLKEEDSSYIYESIASALLEPLVPITSFDLIDPVVVVTSILCGVGVNNLLYSVFDKKVFVNHGERIFYKLIQDAPLHVLFSKRAVHKRCFVDSGVCRIFTNLLLAASSDALASDVLNKCPSFLWDDDEFVVFGIPVDEKPLVFDYIDETFEMADFMYDLFRGEMSYEARYNMSRALVMNPYGMSKHLNFTTIENFFVDNMKISNPKFLSAQELDTLLKAPEPIRNLIIKSDIKNFYNYQKKTSVKPVCLGTIMNLVKVDFNNYKVSDLKMRL